jgi:phosphatidylinositol-3-phosphatase
MRTWARIGGVALALILLAVAVGILVRSHHATPVPASTALIAPAASALVAPTGAGVSRPPTRIVVVILENHSYADIVGNPSAPFLNGTIVPNALTLTDMHANAHPSLPNYVWLAAGQACGATNDHDWNRSCASVFDQLQQAGAGWAVYAEGYPGDANHCSLASTSDRLANDYARKHVPPLLFTSTSSGAACTDHVRNFPGDKVADNAPPAANFHGVDLPGLTFVVPNLCHDMHNRSLQCRGGGGGVAAADAWLRLNWADLVAGAGPTGVVVLTWDEADDGDPPIPTFVAGQRLAGTGTQDGGRYDHASTLRAIQDTFGLPCLAGACQARPLPLVLAPTGAR